MTMNNITRKVEILVGILMRNFQKIIHIGINVVDLRI